MLILNCYYFCLCLLIVNILFYYYLFAEACNFQRYRRISDNLRNMNQQTYGLYFIRFNQQGSTTTLMSYSSRALDTSEFEVDIYFKQYGVLCLIFTFKRNFVNVFIWRILIVLRLVCQWHMLWKFSIVLVQFCKD